MSFVSNCLVIFYIFIISQRNDYKYILIITGKNCTPCIVSADEFLGEHHIHYKLINLYKEKAEKAFSDEIIKQYCKESKHSSYISIKSRYKFGKYTFLSEDGGPVLIKYSKSDTLIYNPSDIDTITD